MASDPDLVRATLESLQLGQYSTAFIHAGYDSLEKASHLTDEILKTKLGISLPGHRRRILLAMKPSDKPETSTMEDTSHEDPIYDEEGDEEGEIYDLPPTPRSVVPQVKPRVKTGCPDYLNFRELEIIPTPMLPPKQKKYQEDDRLKFGIGQSPEVSDCLKSGIGQFPEVSDASFLSNTNVSAKRPPVAKPRQSVQLDDKPPPLPPPRVVSSSSLPLGEFPKPGGNAAVGNSLVGVKPSHAVQSVQSYPEGNPSNSRVVQDSRFCDDLISFDPVSKFTNWSTYGNTADDVSSNYDILTQTSSAKVDIQQQSEDDSLSSTRPSEPNLREAPKAPLVKEVTNSPTFQFYCSNSGVDVPGETYEGHRYEGLVSQADDGDDLIYEGDSPVSETPTLATTITRPAPSPITRPAPPPITRPAPPPITRPAPPPPRCAPTKIDKREELSSNDSYEFMNTEGPDMTPVNEAPKVTLRPKLLQKSFFLSKTVLQKDVKPIPAKRELSRPGIPLPTSIPPPTNPSLNRGQESIEIEQDHSGEILYEDCDLSNVNEYVGPTEWVPEAVKSTLEAPIPPKRPVRRHHDKEDGASSEAGSDVGYFSTRSTLVGSSSETFHERDDVSVSSQKSGPRFILSPHSGYLHIVVNSASTDALKMWCILEGRSLYCLESDKKTSRRETIDMKEILSISVINDTRNENTFQMIHRSPDKSITFSAELSTDMKLWITKLAQNMADVDEEDLEHITELDRGGHVLVKLSTDTASYRGWVHLSSKTLYIYTKEEEFEEIDLRKSKSIKFLDTPCDGRNPILAFLLQLTNNRVIEMRGETKKETESWFSAIRRFMLDVDGSLSNQVLTSENVPVLVDKCITFISSYAMRTVGIYRLTGQNSKITKLLNLLRADPREVLLRTDDYQVHEVATALKRFLRCLDEPLMTSNLYSNWIETAKMDAMTSKLHRYKCLLDQLSLVNYCTLKRIVVHLARVAELDAANKMSTENLASIFGPILLSGIKIGSVLPLTEGSTSPQATTPLGSQSPPDLSPEHVFSSVKEEIIVIKDILMNTKQLFEVKDEEVEQEKRIQEAVERIEALNNQDKHSTLSTMLHESFMIGVYIGNRAGDVINVKIPLSMSGQELQNHITSQMSIHMIGLWTLFEVICDGQLERPIHCTECVFDIALTWNSWPVEFCRCNYICFKQNTLYDTLKVLHQPGMTLCAELKFSRSQKFRKMYFEFSNNQLSCRKDIKASSPSTIWDVSSLIIYVGVQRQRFPPTAWGISFYFGGGNPLSLGSNCFGFSLCCKNEEEMCVWLSALLHSQYPEGLLPREGAVITTRSKTLSRFNSEPALPSAAPTLDRSKLITNLRQRLVQMKHDTISKIASSIPSSDR